MGWSHGIDTNREEGDQDIGYGVEAECDAEVCHAKINRGLYHVCGSERSRMQAEERRSGRANIKEHQILKHPNLERMIMQEENRQKDMAKKLKKLGLNPKRCSCYEADMALAQ